MPSFCYCWLFSSLNSLCCYIQALSLQAALDTHKMKGIELFVFLLFFFHFFLKWFLMTKFSSKTTALNGRQIQQSNLGPTLVYLNEFKISVQTTLYELHVNAKEHFGHGISSVVWRILITVLRFSWNTSNRPLLLSEEYNTVSFCAFQTPQKLDRSQKHRPHLMIK